MKNTLQQGFPNTPLYVFFIFVVACTSNEPAALPSVRITAPVQVTQITATLSAEVTSQGGYDEVPARGAVWSTSPKPTIYNNYNYSAGRGVGSFSTLLYNLKPSTTYFARAFVQNSMGTSYSGEITFTTLAAVAPTITTRILAFGGNTAGVEGVISADGGSRITVRGVAWGITAGPTINDNKAESLLWSETHYKGSGLGYHKCLLKDLTPNTTYYTRAFATTEAGTFYGNELSFQTTSIAVGDFYQGGIVVYILRPGDPGYDPNVIHGLISSDLIGSSSWGCNTEIPGADGTTVGTGLQNTLDIIAACPTQVTAARICYDLTIGNYNDWYLPSKGELNQLLLNSTALNASPAGHFGYIYYLLNGSSWSSTEGGTMGTAWIMGTLYQTEGQQTLNVQVRAFRNF